MLAVFGWLRLLMTYMQPILLVVGFSTAFFAGQLSFAAAVLPPCCCRDAPALYNSWAPEGIACGVC